MTPPTPPVTDMPDPTTAATTTAYELEVYGRASGKLHLQGPPGFNLDLRPYLPNRAGLKWTVEAPTTLVGTNAKGDITARIRALTPEEAARTGEAEP